MLFKSFLTSENESRWDWIVWCQLASAVLVWGWDMHFPEQPGVWEGSRGWGRQSDRPMQSCLQVPRVASLYCHSTPSLSSHSTPQDYITAWLQACRGTVPPEGPLSGPLATYATLTTGTYGFSDFSTSSNLPSQPASKAEEVSKSFSDPPTFPTPHPSLPWSSPDHIIFHSFIISVVVLFFLTEPWKIL